MVKKFLGTIGAFEVYYNDIVLYSKLSKKILPKIKDINLLLVYWNNIFIFFINLNLYFFIFNLFFLFVLNNIPKISLWMFN